MKKTVDTQQDCAHCHQPILTLVVGKNEENNFCCYGCKVVFELLQDGNHIIAEGALNLKKYAYLDTDGVREKILKFEHEAMASVHLHLPEIHCSSCIFLLEGLPQIVEGVLEVQVNFGKKQAAILFRQDQIALSKVAALLSYIGYPPDFNAVHNKPKKTNNNLLIQLGVAGFFFGNTMLLALPTYFDTDLAHDVMLQRFFHFLMLLFSLPVVFYSAKDYFLTAYKSLRSGYLSIDFPIALGIAALFLRSVYEITTSYGAGYFDSLAGLVFFLLIGKWYQQKTYENLTFDRDFKSFLPLAANVILANGKEEIVAVENLKKGDLLMLRHEEIVATDVVLESQKALVDYSYITGEAVPIQKQKGETIFAGGKMIGAAARAFVATEVSKSYLASLWQKDSFKNATHKKEALLINQVAQYFTPAILILALGAAIFWSFTDIQKAFYVFAAVLIVACPCALALAEPFASGSMLRWLGRSGFFLKSSGVLTKLATIDFLVFDKTGTLTQQTNMNVSWFGETLSEEDTAAVASIFANTTHPVAKPIAGFLQAAIHENITDFSEVVGQGISAKSNNNNYKIGSSAFVQADIKTKTTAVFVQKNGYVLGYFELQQKIRAELQNTINALPPNTDIAVLSGDNDAEAARFAQILGPNTVLKFNQSPHEKLEFIAQLQAQGHKVLMIGDGLNDAGALQQSDVGISLCEEKVNFFPASDALLRAASFGNLGTYLQLAEKTKKITKQAFKISLGYNLIGLSFAVSGFLSPLVCAILMPISSVSVVVYSTLKTKRAAQKALTSKNLN